MRRQPFYQIPDNRKVRVIIDTDAYAEGDDQYAIVHALMTPKFEVMGIVAEHFADRFDNTMEKSYEELERLMEKMPEFPTPIFRGQRYPLGKVGDEPISDGVQFIIDEAKRQDPRPLFVLNMGAVTNLAKAYQAAPEIGGLLTAIWIGGGPYGGAIMDFNAGNDPLAANVLIGSSIELWQIPMTAYTQMEVSFHELYDRVRPYGQVGAYIFENLLRVSDVESAMDFSRWPMFEKASPGARTMIIRSGEGWSLGDSPAVGVLITGQGKYQEIRPAQYINPDGSYGDEVGQGRMVRVYHSIDSRIILEDFFAKLKYQYQEV